MTTSFRHTPELALAKKVSVSNLSKERFFKNGLFLTKQIYLTKHNLVLFNPTKMSNIMTNWADLVEKEPAAAGAGSPPPTEEGWIEVSAPKKGKTTESRTTDPATASVVQNLATNRFAILADDDDPKEKIKELRAKAWHFLQRLNPPMINDEWEYLCNSSYYDFDDTAEDGVRDATEEEQIAFWTRMLAKLAHEVDEKRWAARKAAALQDQYIADDGTCRAHDLDYCTQCRRWASGRGHPDEWM